jgi:acetoin utilization deacetylase AcuC-like enzyme
LKHDMGAGHPESPERLRAIVTRLEQDGVMPRLIRVDPVAAADEWITQIHKPSYVAALKQHAPASGRVMLDADTSMSPGSLPAAYLAAGGILAAADAIMAGRVDNVFCAVRPPGHHAEHDRAMGFCLFNNVAIAARYFQRRHGLARVLIVDWDVHHGNGTQAAFYSDPTVLTISIHQDGLYPLGSGTLEQRGEGAGRGFNINVPLPPGSGHGAYVETIRQVVVPALRRFRPDVIMVASGLDACSYDPLARMMCHSGTYREMAALLKTAAEELCGGRLVACHEGGYSSFYAPWCALAVVEVLAGVGATQPDPSLGYLMSWPGQDLQPHQADVIRSAASAISAVRA